MDRWKLPECDEFKSEGCPNEKFPETNPDVTSEKNPIGTGRSKPRWKIQEIVSLLLLLLFHRYIYRYI
jgi:hypothetical protein